MRDYLPEPFRVAPQLTRAATEDLRPKTALLLNPFYSKDPHASFGKHVLTPTLALTSIAGATPAGWTVAYWDENLLQGPPPIDPLPEVVGITVHLTFARRAYELAAYYRAHGSKIVLGGLHVLSCPEEAMAPTIVVRTAADPASLLRPMRQTVQSLDEALPVIETATLSQHIADSLGARRKLGALLGALGALGLGLASLGLYIVVIYAVSSRAQEIGIRMTLGARPRRVIWVVSKDVAKLLAVRVTVGLGLSWAGIQGSAAVVSRLNQAEGVGLGFTPPTNPAAFVLVVLLMAAVGLVATFVPAWRATRANPLVALRHL